MSLDSFMTGVLDVMRPIITPDWGKLIVLIPALLTLVVLAYVAVTAAKWVNLYRTAPALPRTASAARGSLVAPNAPQQVKAPAAPTAAIAPALKAAPATAPEPKAEAAPTAATVVDAPSPDSPAAPKAEAAPKAVAGPVGAPAPKKPLASRAAPTQTTAKKHKRFWER